MTIAIHAALNLVYPFLGLVGEPRTCEWMRRELIMETRRRLGYTGDVVMAHGGMSCVCACRLTQYNLTAYFKG